MKHSKGIEMTTSAGAKVVPVEPPEEMLLAGLIQMYNCKPNTPMSSFAVNERIELTKLYKEMLNAAPSAPVQAGELVKRLRELNEFLAGADSIDGLWFGDRHPTKPGAFWWRSEHLGRIEAAAAEIERLSAAAPVEVCETCHGTCQWPTGETSGSESDGNAPEFVRCPECGYGEPADAGSAEPVAVIIDSQFADFGDNRIRAIKLSLGVNLYDDDELYTRPPAPTTAWIDAATVDRNSRPPALKVSDEVLREAKDALGRLSEDAMKMAHGNSGLRESVKCDYHSVLEALELAGRK